MLHVETNDVAHYEGTRIVDKLFELKSFIAERLPATHTVISHPITRTDSKHLAMKIGDIKSHLCQLQIDKLKIKTQTLKSRGLHLNGKGVLQFAKYLIESIGKL